MTQVPTVAHRMNRLLAALEPEELALLEPDLEVVSLPRGQVLYEAGDIIRHVYFPHGAIISLVNVMADGGTTEVAVFGREGVVGLLSALVTREAFGRYNVQLSGTVSRMAFEHPAEPRGHHHHRPGRARRGCVRMLRQDPAGLPAPAAQQVPAGPISIDPLRK